MKRKEKLLWKVLRATTNSPNDVWKDSHYVRHKDADRLIHGDPVKRYTVPIKKVIKTEEGTMYLVIQFSTDKLAFPYFEIPSKVFTEDLKAKSEFVYAINVRLCFDYEFSTHRKRIQIKGMVKWRFRRNIKKKSIKLIRKMPRWKIMFRLTKGKRYSNSSIAELKKIVNLTQFNEEERQYKGLEKNKK